MDCEFTDEERCEACEMVNKLSKPSQWERILVSAAGAIGVDFSPDVLQIGDSEKGWLSFEITETEYIEGTEGLFLNGLTLRISISNRDRLRTSALCDVLIQILSKRKLIRNVVAIEWSFDVDTNVRTAAMTVDINPYTQRSPT